MTKSIGADSDNLQRRYDVCCYIVCAKANGDELMRWRARWGRLLEWSRKGLRRPGIEPGASRWQRDILPLNQRRLANTPNPKTHTQTHTQKPHTTTHTHNTSLHMDKSRHSFYTTQESRNTGRCTLVLMRASESIFVQACC